MDPLTETDFIAEENIISRNLIGNLGGIANESDLVIGPTLDLADGRGFVSPLLLSQGIEDEFDVLSLIWQQVPTEGKNVKDFVDGRTASGLLEVFKL